MIQKQSTTSIREISVSDMYQKLTFCKPLL